jgi:trans-aconitate methyltransferase
MTDLSRAAAHAWQLSWDRQQRAYLTDREERFALMVDVLEAVATGPSPIVLDLAGGTGSISVRVLRRLPEATTMLVDVDPVLLTIARAGLDDRSSVIAADLRSPRWIEALPRPGLDAVLTATALHWLEQERLRALYREVHDLLVPGGVFINADHMPAGELGSTMEQLAVWAQARRQAAFAARAAISWSQWWEHVARDPVLGPRFVEREAVFGGLHPVEFLPPVSWHLEALRAAGFSEVGTLWRGGDDAAVLARR